MSKFFVNFKFGMRVDCFRRDSLGRKDYNYGGNYKKVEVKYSDLRRDLFLWKLVFGD